MLHMQSSEQAEKETFPTTCLYSFFLGARERVYSKMMTVASGRPTVAAQLPATRKCTVMSPVEGQKLASRAPEHRQKAEEKGKARLPHLHFHLHLHLHGFLARCSRLHIIIARKAPLDH